MKHKIVVSALILLFCFKSLSIEKASIPTNKEIFNSFLVSFVDTITKLSSLKYYQIRVAKHSVSDYLENAIVGNLYPLGFKFFSSDCDTCTLMQININKYEISYNRIKREKPTNLVTRKIELELTCLFKHPNTLIEAINFQRIYSDTITTEDLDLIEKDGKLFTAERPKEPENFLKKYFEPIILIGSSALAIILFFSVRSK